MNAPTDDTWNRALADFDALSDIVRRHFWRNHETVFREHELHRKRLDDGVFSVVFEDLFRFFAQMLAAVFVAGLVGGILAGFALVYAAIVGKSMGVPDGFWSLWLQLELSIGIAAVVLDIMIYINVPDYYERLWYLRLSTMLFNKLIAPVLTGMRKASVILRIPSLLREAIKRAVVWGSQGVGRRRGGPPASKGRTPRYKG